MHFSAKKMATPTSTLGPTTTTTTIPLISSSSRSLFQLPTTSLKPHDTSISAYWHLRESPDVSSNSQLLQCGNRGEMFDLLLPLPPSSSSSKENINATQDASDLLLTSIGLRCIKVHAPAAAPTTPFGGRVGGNDDHDDASNRTSVLPLVWDYISSAFSSSGEIEEEEGDDKKQVVVAYSFVISREEDQINTSSPSPPAAADDDNTTNHNRPIGAPSSTTTSSSSATPTTTTTTTPTTPSLLIAHPPRHWTFEGRNRHDATWHVLDERRLSSSVMTSGLSSSPSSSPSLPSSPPWIAFLSSSSIGCFDEYSIVVRDVWESIGGGHAKRMPPGTRLRVETLWMWVVVQSPVVGVREEENNTSDTTLASERRRRRNIVVGGDVPEARLKEVDDDQRQETKVVSVLSLHFPIFPSVNSRGASSRSSRISTHTNSIIDWNWRLFLCGPPGQRHLRLQSSEGGGSGASIDVITEYPLIFSGNSINSTTTLPAAETSSLASSTAGSNEDDNNDVRNMYLNAAFPHCTWEGQITVSIRPCSKRRRRRRRSKSEEKKMQAQTTEEDSVTINNNSMTQKVKVRIGLNGEWVSILRMKDVLSQRNEGSSDTDDDASEGKSSNSTTAITCSIPAEFLISSSSSSSSTTDIVLGAPSLVSSSSSLSSLSSFPISSTMCTDDDVEWTQIRKSQRIYGGKMPLTSPSRIHIDQQPDSYTSTSNGDEFLVLLQAGGGNNDTGKGGGGIDTAFVSQFHIAAPSSLPKKKNDGDDDERITTGADTLIPPSSSSVSADAQQNIQTTTSSVGSSSISSSCSRPTTPTLTPAPRRTLNSPLFTLEHVLLWKPNPEVDANVRSTQRLDQRYAQNSNHKINATTRPLSLVCHDCGPAVYKEDALAGGISASSTSLNSATNLNKSLFTGSIPCIKDVENISVGSSSLLAGSATFSKKYAEVHTLHTSPYKGKSTTRNKNAEEDHSSSSSFSPRLCCGHIYKFEQWQACDIFVYFSHERVTIPPKGWIDAAHKNGVKILGTLITEWSDGEAANSLLCAPYAVLIDDIVNKKKKNSTGTSFSTASTYEHLPQRRVAAQLAAIAAYYGFDGWLVNIEAPVLGSLIKKTRRKNSNMELRNAAVRDGARGSVEAMRAFVEDLTLCLKETVGASSSSSPMCIWYDSIDYRTGAVNWKSSLDTEANVPFLNVCDGVFLDYHWNEELLAQTARLASCSLLPNTTSATARNAVNTSTTTDNHNDSNNTNTISLQNTTTATTTNRCRDVFVGIDMWGRGTFGGGGWKTSVAIQAIREATRALLHQQQQESLLSVALFGPAWVYEGAEEGKGMKDLSVCRRFEKRLWWGEHQETEVQQQLQKKGEKKKSGMSRNELSHHHHQHHHHHEDNRHMITKRHTFKQRVINPNGICKTPSLISAFVGVSHHHDDDNDTKLLLQSCLLTGWNIDSNPGQGWDVVEVQDDMRISEGRNDGEEHEDCDDDDEYSNDEKEEKEEDDREACSSSSPAKASLTSFVTSHKWCWASQVVPLKVLVDTQISSTTESFAICDVIVSEYYAGTQPNFEDLYRFKAALVDCEGKTLERETSGTSSSSSSSSYSFDSRELMCGKEWKQIRHVFKNVRISTSSTSSGCNTASSGEETPPPSKVVVVSAVKIEHGGKDAECWAGHFGARMRGTEVTVKVRVAVLPPQLPLLQSTVDEGSVSNTVVTSRSTEAEPVNERDVDRLETTTATTRTTTTTSNSTGLVHLLGGPRPVTSSLPFSSCFNTGIGCDWFHHGERVANRRRHWKTRTNLMSDASSSSSPWTNLEVIDPLPSYMGQKTYYHASQPSATATSMSIPTAEGKIDVAYSISSVSTRFDHTWAWEGGTSLLLMARASRRNKEKGLMVRTNGMIHVPIFVLDIPAPIIVHVTMMYSVGDEIEDTLQRYTLELAPYLTLSRSHVPVGESNDDTVVLGKPLRETKEIEEAVSTTTTSTTSNAIYAVLSSTSSSSFSRPPSPRSGPKWETCTWELAFPSVSSSSSLLKEKNVDFPDYFIKEFGLGVASVIPHVHTDALHSMQLSSPSSITEEKDIHIRIGKVSIF